MGLASLPDISPQRLIWRTYGSLIISEVGSRRHARGGNLVRSPRAKEGPAPPEHQPCNGCPQGQPAQVRKQDVKKAGRQPPPVPHGQRAMPKVASLGATTGAKDGDAYPKQQWRFLFTETGLSLLASWGAHDELR